MSAAVKFNSQRLAGMAERLMPVLQICTFNDVVHRVQLHVESSVLLIKVEDELTTECWHGSFTAQYVEELTQKAGNYKQFKVFIDMLTKALTSTTTSLELHWLTSSDLQQLYAQRQSTFQLNSTPSNNDRRYLIVTYTAEFDRVHFPLPLTSTGAPDVALLTLKLRDLNARLEAASETMYRPSASREPTEHQPSEAEVEQQQRLHAQLASYRDQTAELRAENQRIQAQVTTLKQQLVNAAIPVAQQGPDLELLKDMILSLERDLTEQKNRFYRSSQLKADRIQKLEAELDAVKASERHLQARCRHLTAEVGKSKRPTSKTASKQPTRHNPQSSQPSPAKTPTYMQPTRSSRSRSRSRQHQTSPSRKA
jgi:coiled-coil domain-containing protein 61